jgi:hypothetical protein
MLFTLSRELFIVGPIPRKDNVHTLRGGGRGMGRDVVVHITLYIFRFRDGRLDYQFCLYWLADSDK